MSDQTSGDVNCQELVPDSGPLYGMPAKIHAAFLAQTFQDHHFSMDFLAGSRSTDALPVWSAKELPGHTSDQSRVVSQTVGGRNRWPQLGSREGFSQLEHQKVTSQPDRSTRHEPWDICEEDNQKQYKHPSSIAPKASSAVRAATERRQSQSSLEQMPMTAAAAAAASLTPQQQYLLLMASRQGISRHQLQNILQQGLSPALQQLIHQQSLVLQQMQHQKLHEQLLHSLNEQLQLNLLHQAQLMKKPGASKSAPSLDSWQPLLLQHQQIMQQMQLVQRQSALASVLQPAGLGHGLMSPTELQHLWRPSPLKPSACDNGSESVGGQLTLSSSQTTDVTSSHSVPPSGHCPDQTGVHHTSANRALTNRWTDLALSLPGMNSQEIAGKKLHSSQGSTPCPKEAASPGEAAPPPSHPLYINSCCQWPNCDSRLPDYSTFIKHLNTDHQLDDRSTAQSRVQMEVVSSLESQLTTQRRILKAMTNHLRQQSLLQPVVSSPFHPQSSPPSSLSSLSSSSLTPSSGTQQSLSTISASSPLTPHSSKKDNFHIHPRPQAALLNQFAAFLPPVSLVASSLLPAPGPHQLPPLIHSPGAHSPPSSILSSHPREVSSGSSSSSSYRAGTDGGGPVRRRVSDKCNLPISTEIHKNREFYKNMDVRPPFTYASLIRQAIIESSHRQLTLNEIYQWFQNTFAYFRRNEATWKNAVRHNLSLHKCFMRVENVKGAVWTVDELEFYKRRPQKLAPGSGDIKLSPVHELPCFNQAVSNSIRAALRQGVSSSRPGSGFLDQERAEDLSVRNNGHETFMSGFGEADLMMRIKSEVQDTYPDLELGLLSSTTGNLYQSRATVQDDQMTKLSEVQHRQEILEEEDMADDGEKKHVPLDYEGIEDYSDEEFSREQIEEHLLKSTEASTAFGSPVFQTEFKQSSTSKHRFNEEESSRFGYSELEIDCRFKENKNLELHNHERSASVRLSPPQRSSPERNNYNQNCRHDLERTASFPSKEETLSHLLSSQGSQCSDDQTRLENTRTDHNAGVHKDSTVKQLFVVDLPESETAIPSSFHSSTASLSPEDVILTSLQS